MYFKDRSEGGRLLAQKLQKYQGQEVVVFALPRGGVVTAVEVARFLKAPLDLILAHKIGHPQQPEYAIAALSEEGHLLITSDEAKFVKQEWLDKEKERVMTELKKRRSLFLKGKAMPYLKGKIALLVDDGIATGSTMKVGILQLKAHQPAKIVVAVPVAPRSTAEEIAATVDEFIAVKTPDDADFMGAVGAHYEDFPQVEDDEVITLIENYAAESS